MNACNRPQIPDSFDEVRLRLSFHDPARWLINVFSWKNSVNALIYSSRILTDAGTSYCLPWIALNSDFWLQPSRFCPPLMICIPPLSDAHDLATPFCKKFSYVRKNGPLSMGRQHPMVRRHSRGFLFRNFISFFRGSFFVGLLMPLSKFFQLTMTYDNGNTVCISHFPNVICFLKWGSNLPSRVITNRIRLLPIGTCDDSNKLSFDYSETQLWAAKASCPPTIGYL